MKIECIVTSYNYGDYLYYTLPSMVRTFDRVIVITDKDDKDTIMACEKCLIEPVFIDPTIGGAIFKKGYMIDKALKKHVEFKDWVILTDADILFEEGTREKIEKQVHPDKNILYGAYRRHVPSFEAFVDYLQDKKISNEWQRGERRFLKLKKAVLGFFQLTRYDKIPRFSLRFSLPEGKNMYPDTSGRASHDDFYFQRCRVKQFLPIDVIHLSEREKNWEGRVTEKFDEISLEKIKDKGSIYLDNVNDLEKEMDKLMVGKFIIGSCNNETEFNNVTDKAFELKYRISSNMVDGKIYWWILKNG